VQTAGLESIQPGRFFAQNKKEDVLPDGPTALATPQTKTCLRGPRFARPLRGAYTGREGMIFFGPTVGRGQTIPANGRADAVYLTQTS
jgi:hypothetical protein